MHVLEKSQRRSLNTLSNKYGMKRYSCSRQHCNEIFRTTFRTRYRLLKYLQVFFRNYVSHVHIKIRTNKAPSQLSGAKDKENKKKKFFVTMETSIAFKHSK